MQRAGSSCGLCWLVNILVVIGALNWGLVGLFGFNLVGALVGDFSAAARVVYVLVGIAGVTKLVRLFKPCPCQQVRTVVV